MHGAVAHSATHHAGASHAGGAVHAGGATHSPLAMRSANPTRIVSGAGTVGHPGTPTGSLQIGGGGFRRGRRRRFGPWGRWGWWGYPYPYPYAYPYYNYPYTTQWVPTGTTTGTQCFYSRESGQLNCSGQNYPGKVLQVSGTNALVESPAVFTTATWVPIL